MEPTTTTPENPPTQTKPARPKRTDESVLQAAISKLVEPVAKWAKEGGDFLAESVKAPLERACRHKTDGYEIARELDSQGWSPDAKLVDILDNLGMYKSTAFGKAQDEWLKSNGITPPFVPGTKVKAQWGHEEIVGVIKADEARHYSPSGQYSLDVEGRKGAPIVNWEDCQAA